MIAEFVESRLRRTHAIVNFATRRLNWRSTAAWTFQIGSRNAVAAGAAMYERHFRKSLPLDAMKDSKGELGPESAGDVRPSEIFPRLSSG